MISGIEGIGLNGNGDFFEKCIVVENHICILRINCTGDSKIFVDQHLTKISDSFTEYIKE